jgi:hypothetical protein
LCYWLTRCIYMLQHFEIENITFIVVQVILNMFPLLSIFKWKAARFLTGWSLPPYCPFLQFYGAFLRVKVSQAWKLNEKEHSYEFHRRFEENDAKYFSKFTALLFRTVGLLSTRQYIIKFGNGITIQLQTLSCSLCHRFFLRL